ncbi:hypothetical protein NFI96_002781 [Prochilodus magdalenae]|nr:hypothetical protein NFI96_002781 [Prochilodus magdalenae]
MEGTKASQEEEWERYPMDERDSAGPELDWAEPILARVKEDHTRVILPAIDNIKYNTFEVQQYANAAHGYNWGLWCMYIIPPQDWLDKGDETAPIRNSKPRGS